MLILPENIRIFLRRDPTDMRLGYNGLSALVGSAFGQNPTSGHLFVFVNRHKNRAKMLLWERGGFWSLSRRLERGAFALPEVEPPLRVRPRVSRRLRNPLRPPLTLHAIAHTRE